MIAGWMAMPSVVWIDWRPHNRRAKSIAQDIGARLYLAPHILRRKIYAPLRYIYLTLWTLIILLRNRPDVIIASTPPPFCPIILFMYAKIFRCSYIVDAHHLATTGYWTTIPFGFSFNKFVMNNAIATLVHNQKIQELTHREGIRSMVLETRTPEIGNQKRDLASEGFSVLVPCSFDPDEPIGSIYEAAEKVCDTIFYLTGDLSRLSRKLQTRRPHNVRLTGFLSESEYDMMLNSVDTLLVLSNDYYPLRPRGASEAIAAEKPLIVSENGATRNDLYKGGILINNTSEGIVRAVLGVKDRYERYQCEMRELKEERGAQYKVELGRLKELIKGNVGGRMPCGGH